MLRKWGGKPHLRTVRPQSSTSQRNSSRDAISLLRGRSKRRKPLPPGGRMDRVPPNSLEAERAVLGGILLQNNVIDTVLEIIKVDDFYSEGNARIYEAAMELH